MPPLAAAGRTPTTPPSAPPASPPVPPPHADQDRPQMDYCVTVTGATGKTGAHVARLGTERGWRVRGAGRRPPAHGEWTPFSWDDETTWKPAFDGSQAAYVVIPFNSPGAPAR